MQVAFSTVVRSAPPDRGGELLLLDWATKLITHRTPISASEPVVNDPNPRGNSRGGRGIVHVDGEWWVASYHSLLRFDSELRPRGRVTHPLFAGLHEVAPAADGVLWVAATAIDAAVGVRLPGGESVGDLHPREIAEIGTTLDVQPKDLDKSIDNRLLHLTRPPGENEHHLHLNAVRVIDGDVHALFSRVGAVANLSTGTIVLRDPHLATAHPHNLALGADGRRYVSDTYGPAVRIYRPDWSLEKAIPLLDSPVVADIRRVADRQRKRRGLLRRARHDTKVARPLFMRGLAVVDEGHVLVGISPATLLLVDTVAGTVVDHFAFSTDVHTAVHGLVTRTT